MLLVKIKLVEYKNDIQAVVSELGSDALPEIENTLTKVCRDVLNYNNSRNMSQEDYVLIGDLEDAIYDAACVLWPSDDPDISMRLMIDVLDKIPNSDVFRSLRDKARDMWFEDFLPGVREMHQSMTFEEQQEMWGHQMPITQSALAGAFGVAVEGGKPKIRYNRHNVANQNHPDAYDVQFWRNSF